MTTIIHSYKDLIVWRKSMDLVCLIYDLTERFPREEIYGLTSQMRSAAVSIPSNIAEGRRRGTKKDYLRFLRIAFGSGVELETQIGISKRLQKTKHIDFSKAESLLEEVLKMLSAMLVNLNPRPSIPKKLSS